MLRYVRISLLLGVLIIIMSASAIAASYDRDAGNVPSPNDVKAMVYHWFAGFDHQRGLDYFLPNLDSKKVRMEFPNFPINTLDDFKRWYNGVQETVQWNNHDLHWVNVTGDAKQGFKVSILLTWKAKTYATIDSTGQNIEALIWQNWMVIVDKSGRLIIAEHKAGAAK